MDCVLFRHGIAVELEHWNGHDAQRPLTPRGAEKTREAAIGLLRLGVNPTVLLSSPYRRALETAKILREVFQLDTDAQRCEELVPGAPPDQIIGVLGSLGEDESVICVGHEPNLGHAAALMAAGGLAPGLSLKKAGACCVRFERMPKPGEGVLRWWLMPGQLRDFGKR